MALTVDDLAIPNLTPGDGSWQKHCVRILKACIDEEAKLKNSGSVLWAAAKKELIKQNRVILADGDFSNRDMEGFDLSYSYIVRCSFIETNLRSSKFWSCVIKETNFSSADLRDMSFFNSAVVGCDFNRPKISDRTSFRLAQWKNSYATPILDEKIRRMMSETEIDHIEMAPSLRFWMKITKNGEGIGKILLLSLVWNVAIGTLLFFLDNKKISIFDKNDGRINFDEAIIVAFQKFLNANSMYNSVDRLLNIIFFLQAFLGVAALGLILTVIARKLILIK